MVTKNDAFDMSKNVETFFKSFAIDNSAFDGALKSASEFNAKLGQIAIEAARKNAEITNTWTNETLKSLEGTASAKDAVSDYSKVATDFSSAQAQAMPEKLAAYVEVAKNAQLATIELMMAAGKDVQAEVTKVATEVAKTAKKAA